MNKIKVNLNFIEIERIPFIKIFKGIIEFIKFPRY